MAGPVVTMKTPDAFADVLTELCHVGYPQSPPELRQELIAEQFVRGQSDPELKKYLWVVIRTQKDRKLQTFIEICTDFSSLSTPTHLHRPAEQTFAVHQQMGDALYGDSEALGDRPPWKTTRGARSTHTPTDVRFGSADGIRDATYQQTDRCSTTAAWRSTTCRPESGVSFTATDWT